MEEMVNTVLPAKKRLRKKKPKMSIQLPPVAIQPLPSAIKYFTPPAQQEQDEAFTKLLDNLIRAEPLPSLGTSVMANNQATPQTMEVV